MKKDLVLLTALSVIPVLCSCGSSNRVGAVENGLEEYARLARTVPLDSGRDNGSLWSDGAGYGDGFRDIKAKRVADLITIQVIESTSAVSEATTDSNRESDMSGGLTNFGGLEGKVKELPNLLDVSSSNEFSGDASTTRKSVVKTSLTARVVEVFPNGNLLLEGNRELEINGERQLVVVRGIARPNDITSDNIILSTRIAELQLELKGKGIVSEAQQPGILFKVLSGIWPF